jgi:uncharacterized protein
LRQHAENPVDWYPWGEEALTTARESDKPILLSIGYSACHWCHVMAHESFEDETTAALMNERFVSIKVDREERPDLDQIYMMAVQGMTGQGGWPMTVFLTPEGKPFYGGTYFPPTDRQGMPSFRRVLASVSEAYQLRRSEILDQGEKVSSFIRQHTLLAAPVDALSLDVLDEAFDALVQGFDARNGGFGGAPKFPQAMALEFLLRFHARTAQPAALEMVEITLRKMATGGVYDQVGGGFHRYSVDDHWLVPHFEKMLYDNALLSRAYLFAHQVTGKDSYRRIAEETLDFVARELTDANGGFYSTLDADSEGHEGKYYVWSSAQFDAIVGTEHRDLARAYFGVSDQGNFEGQNILTAPADPEQFAAEHDLSLDALYRVVNEVKQRLMAARTPRVRPGLDDKILAAWNGLMLRSFAEAARILGRPADLSVAAANAEFVERELWREGRLYRIHKDGETKIVGYLEDYAGIADGLLALYQATYDPRWFVLARDIADQMLALFWETESNAFFDAASDGESLVARARDVWDNATPSGTSLACHVLLKLWSLTGESRYRDVVETTLTTLADIIRQHAVGMGNLASALEFLLAPPQEVAVVGDPASEATQRLLEPLRARYLPNAVVALGRAADSGASVTVPLLADRMELSGLPTAYVCRGQVCDLPTTDADELLAKLISS